MKAKKLLALLLCALMLVSIVGCKKDDDIKDTGNPVEVDDDDKENDDDEDNQVTKAPDEDEDDDDEVVEVKEASIDFEDDLYGFVALYTTPANAGKSEFAIADFNGSKALKVTNVDGKVPYVAIDIASLVGDKIAEVNTVTMEIGIENPDGEFYACSGKITAFSGEDRHESKDPWAVYLEDKNPNTATAVLDEGDEFVAGYQNMIIVSLETDNGATDGAANANFYIDDIRIMDASGNVIKGDSSVAFDEPAGFSDVDRVNLIPVKNEVEIWSNDSDVGWAQGTGVLTLNQDGGTFDPALITPDSVITINFQSEGDIWLIACSWVDNAPFSWQRVANEGASIKNPSNTIAQVTYDQLVEYCGTDDFVTYLDQLQCESDVDWSVTNVTIGERSGIVALKNEVVLWTDDSGEGYAQGSGVTTLRNEGTLDPELIQPGCVFNIDYKSEGDMWLVFQSWADGSPFGWQRVAEEGAATMDGKTCQITYDQIVEICGTEDFVEYLDQLQCEGNMPWEVYKVSIGYPSGIVSVCNEVEIEGLAGDSDVAWAQGTGASTLDDGGAFDPALIQPGCVFTIDYESEGIMWLVCISGVDGSPFSWQRVADQGVAADNGKRAQVTYDQMVEMCGTDDFVTYLSKLQCESDFDWEVYKVTIGYPVE